MTTIRGLINAVEAGLLVSFLKDNQIEAILADENASAWVGARLLVPIRLQVADDQAEQALALLEEFDAAPPLAGDEDRAD